MYRTLVILRQTFKEAVIQPIYSLVLGVGGAVLLIFAMLPFFTLSADTQMYKSVALDVILLLVLVVTLFATSKSVFEEIEDRTMLTLMSKPVHKWEVLLGKYGGIVLASLLAVGILGAITAVGTWWRVPADHLIRPDSIDDRELRELAGLRIMYLSGLLPALVLKWLQIAALAAVGVALSTRVPLVVNLPAVIFIYIAGNLTRFLYPLTGQPLPAQILAVLASTLLPALELFDLNRLTIFQKIAVRHFAADPTAVSLSTIWGYVALAAGYWAVYSTFALSVGLWMFHHRELGGAEG